MCPSSRLFVQMTRCAFIRIRLGVILPEANVTRAIEFHVSGSASWRVGFEAAKREGKREWTRFTSPVKPIKENE
jgi:hypothetical protein